MATRNICELGEEILRKRAKEVRKVNRKILDLLDDMAQTLQEANGLGLAAPQVGILKRLIVVDVGDGLIELINPVLVEQEGEQLFMEGCLSYPGYFGNVRRPGKVKVRAMNREEQEIELEADEVLAVALCHEMDHLDGMMFVDKVVGKIYTAEELAKQREEEDAKKAADEAVQKPAKTVTQNAVGGTA